MEIPDSFPFIHAFKDIKYIAMCRYVYDNVVEAEMYMVYDTNKRLLSVGDIYPAEATLNKGEYTIKLLLRHDSPALLERMSDMTMVVERKLKDPISISTYPTHADGVNEENAVKDFTLTRGISPIA